MTNVSGRDPAGQALVASDQAASRLAPTGFDPSRRPMAALAQLRLELGLCEQVFRQYGFQHLDKAEAARDDPREYNARMQKAWRNTERADCCKRALDFFDSQGGIDGYQASGIETEGQDPTGLGAEHESPAREAGDAQ